MTKLLHWQNCMDKSQVGNKAWGLAKLKAAGFLVPDFMVIPANCEIPASVEQMFKDNVLISVRSGSVVSLPGLMVSYLNVNQNQVMEKIQLVKNSWNNEATRAVKAKLKIDSSIGTAVILQSMVPKSTLIGSGVASSFHPITKNLEMYASYSPKVYGDKVVIDGSESEVPEEYQSELKEILTKAEALFGKPQEIEFCITLNGIYLLQSRDLVLAKENFSDEKNGSLIGQGQGSAQGVVSGRVSFSNAQEGDILCVKSANPSLLASLINAKAVLSRSGDHNSHLAVLCRLLGKPYILSAKLTGRVTESARISLDTDSGEIWIEQ